MPSLLTKAFTKHALQTLINPPDTQGWAQTTVSKKARQGVSSKAWTVMTIFSSLIISVTQGKFTVYLALSNLSETLRPKETATFPPSSVIFVLSPGTSDG